MLLQKVYKNSCILKLFDNAIEYGTLQLCCIFLIQICSKLLQTSYCTKTISHKNFDVGIPLPASSLCLSIFSCIEVGKDNAYNLVKLQH